MFAIKRLRAQRRQLQSRCNFYTSWQFRIYKDSVPALGREDIAREYRLGESARYVSVKRHIRFLSDGPDMPVCLGTDPTGAIEYRILSKDRLEEALAVQQLSMHHECIAIGMGMYEEAGAAEEMKLVFREVVKDGCTLIAVDQSDRIVAVAFNKLRTPPKPGETDSLEVFVENNIKHRPCRDLIDFLGDVESRVDIFQKYNARGAMEIFYIGTDPRYRGRGIGLQITDMSLKLARGLRARKLKQIWIGKEIVNEGVRPEVAFAAVASIFSQRIMEKLNFETLFEARYEDYIRGGKKMSDRISCENQTIKFVARKL